MKTHEKYENNHFKILADEPQNVKTFPFTKKRRHLKVRSRMSIASLHVTSSEGIMLEERGNNESNEITFIFIVV